MILAAIFPSSDTAMLACRQEKPPMKCHLHASLFFTPYMPLFRFMLITIAFRRFIEYSVSPMKLFS
jgi:hypothetical protein